MDVGVDNIFRRFGMWRPISLDEVIKLLGPGHEADRVPGPFEEGADGSQDD
jgi:hypothetical protein